MLKKVYSRIALAGVGPSTPPALARRLIVTNKLSFTIFWVTVPYILLFHLLGAELYALIVVYIAGAYLLFPFLNSLGRHELSRMWMITHFNCAVFAYSCFFGEQSGIYLCFFTLICMPLVIYELKDRWQIAVGMSLPVAGYLLLGWAGFALPFLPAFPASPQMLRTVYWAIVVSNFVMLGAAVLYFYVINERYETKLQGYVDRLRAELEARQQAEAKIAAQQVTLVSTSKMSALGEMASGIAHEINSPLAVIQLKAGLLQEMIESGSAERELLRENAVQIETMTERIAKIIDSLRSFAREVSADPFAHASMATIVDDALTFCHQRFLKHRILVQLDPGISALALECRMVQLVQVLLNLLSNSFDALEGTEGERWVRIGGADLGQHIRVTIEDCGMGVPPGIRDRIFDPFFTTKGPGKGTGLGLSISKGFVESHQGKLYLDPETPWTRFVIELPKRQTGAR